VTAKEKQRMTSKEKRSRRTADIDGRGAEEQLSSECELSYQLSGVVCPTEWIIITELWRVNSTVDISQPVSPTVAKQDQPEHAATPTFDFVSVCAIHHQR
jgi:hypothetical protein